MAKAKKVQELIITTPNEVGTLGSITDELALSGINIFHMSAYAKEEKGYFMIITSDNGKAKGILENMGYEVGTRDTLEIEFENKRGALAPIAKKLGDNSIDIEYIFATSADGKKVLGIISTNDNDMALGLINEQ